WAALRMGESLEKVASEQVGAQETARLCDRIAGHVLKTASAQFPNDLRGKEAAVASTIRFMLSIRDTHLATGEKTAASNEGIATELQKLAYAVYTDTLISEQLTKLAGTDYTKARLTQLLGREYMVDIMRRILG
ncbi:MAG: hypothetical protein ACRC8U_14755, partial [Brooklawnia sp.]